MKQFRWINNESINMNYTRSTVAKVALGIATEDEIFWVNKCQENSDQCRRHVADIRVLANVSGTNLCLDHKTLVRAGDDDNVTEAEHDHLMTCSRCAHIGQYIANMPDHRAVSEDLKYATA